MTRDDVPRGPDPDDWFSEPDVTESYRDQPAAATTEAPELDDWLDESATAAPRRRRRGGGGNDARTAIAVGIGLIVLVLVGLAIAGVFNGSKSKAPPPLFTIKTQTSKTSTTTGKTSTTTLPTVATAPTTTLKPGDTGPEVRVLQRALAHLGYTVGTIDGVYGPGTTQAVKNFQTAKNLTADGVAGPQTIAALKTALTSG